MSAKRNANNALGNGLLVRVLTGTSGLFWNAFMVDHDNLYFVASWDTAQMNDAEVDACCELLADVMRKLGDEGNWEKSVGDVFQS